MSAPELVTCPACEGAGVQGECANDGTHGCSHIFDREWTCWTCRGEGEVTREDADAYADELLAQWAATQAPPPRPVTTVPGVDAWESPEPF